MSRTAVVATLGTCGLLVLGALALPLLFVAVVSGPGAAAGAGGCTAQPGPAPGALGAAGTVGASLTRAPDASHLSGVQLANAATIVAVGQQRRIPAQGIVVALATASQESGFRNYANDGVVQYDDRGRPDLAPDQRDVARSLRFPHDAVGTDHGSVNAFQQQYPGWGSLEELMEPATAAAKFYQALLAVPGWAAMPVTVAAQSVQHSAFGAAYADDEPLARQLLQQLSGAGAGSGPVGTGPVASVPVSWGAPVCAGAPAPPVEAAPGAQGWTLPLAPGSYRLSSGYGPRPNPTGGGTGFHAGLDFAAPAGTTIRAAGAGQVTHAGPANGYGNLVVVTTGDIDVYYAHQLDGGITVTVGQQILAGQPIGAVGSTGHSTGNHLHFEVRVDGASTDPVPFLRQHGVVPRDPTVSARAQRPATWWWAGSAAAALAGVLLLLPAQATHPRPQAPTHPAGTTAPPAATAPPGIAAPGTQGPTASPPPPPTAAATPAPATAAPVTPLPSPPSTAVSGATTQIGGPVGGDAGEPAGQAPPSAWLPVARGFARDFADPGPSHQDWMTRTSRWTTPALAALNDLVDPTAVPAATVTTVEASAVGEDVVDVVATYDTGLRLLCRLQDGTDGWKVTTVVPADA